MLRSVQGSTTIFAAFTNAPQGSTTAEKQHTLEGGNVNESPPAAAILLNEDQDASSGDERDAKVKPQGLKLPYTIPAEVEAYPPAVPTVREENSSIDNVVDDGLADAAAASDDIVVDESEANPILDVLLDCADVTGDQALLCHLWENVARSIRAS
jgi:hypothetical protein